MNDDNTRMTDDPDMSKSDNDGTPPVERISRRDAMKGLGLVGGVALGTQLAGSPIGSASAQEAQNFISGNVKFDDPSEPEFEPINIENARVYAIPHNQNLDVLTTMTDAAGNYSFTESDLHIGVNNYTVISFADAEDTGEDFPVDLGAIEHYPFVLAGEPIPDVTIYLTDRSDWWEYSPELSVLDDFPFAGFFPRPLFTDMDNDIYWLPNHDNDDIYSFNPSDNSFTSFNVSGTQFDDPRRGNVRGNYAIIVSDSGSFNDETNVHIIDVTTWNEADSLNYTPVRRLYSSFIGPNEEYVIYGGHSNGTNIRLANYSPGSIGSAISTLSNSSFTEGIITDNMVLCASYSDGDIYEYNLEGTFITSHETDATSAGDFVPNKSETMAVSIDRDPDDTQIEGGFVLYSLTGNEQISYHELDFEPVSSFFNGDIYITISGRVDGDVALALYDVANDDLTQATGLAGDAPGWTVFTVVDND